MISFMLSCFFIFRIIELCTKNKPAAFLGVFIFATNINMLFMQTMAMSESLFVLTMVASLYYLISWTKENTVTNLIKSAFWIALATLVRYESYFILAFSPIIVIMVTLIKNWNNKQKRLSSLEGKLIIFLTLASFGFIIWTVYLWVIFKDPLYWKHFYGRDVTNGTGLNFLIQTAAEKKADIYQYKNLTASIISYWWAIVNANGFVTAMVGLFSFIYLIIKGILQKKLSYLPIIIVPLSVCAFMIFSLYSGGIPLRVPYLSFIKFFDKSLNNNFDELNIRYGLMLLPFVAIFISLLFSHLKGKVAIFKILLITAILFQTYQVFWGDKFLLFRFDQQWDKNRETDSVKWFKNNYDSGLILVSAFSQDSSMFQLELPYKKYIHEGTQKYWDDSLKNPGKYARWIFVSNEISGDKPDYITIALQKKPQLLSNFTKVYSDAKSTIYKINTQPEIKIQ